MMAQVGLSQITKLYTSYMYTLLKSDVTRRDHVSVVMDPMNVGLRIVNFIVNFIRDGTVFISFHFHFILFQHGKLTSAVAVFQ